MTARWFIGLESGSGGAGVEAALVEVTGAGLDLQARPVQILQLPFSSDLREFLRRVAGYPNPRLDRQSVKESRTANTVEFKQVGLLHRLLGETFAAAARQVVDRASFSLQKVLCLGSPGHTIWHEPEGRFPSTLSLGMAATIAERTGITTVSDFRSRDLAAGGQGASLTALVDYLLFHHPEENRVILQLGGVARMVYLPAGGKSQQVQGFEIGPCNLLLDGLVGQMTGGREPFDPGGKHAVQGRCVDSLLEEWLAQAYLKRRPPKSMPPYAMAEDLILQAVQLARQGRCRLHDLLCTATHFVARSIGQSWQRFIPPSPLPTRVLLSGGGVHNGFLWHLLEQHFAPLSLSKIVGIPADSWQCVASAVLAALTIDGIPGNLPSVTGAAGGRLLGSITPGSSSNWARCLAWMASQMPPPADEWNGD